MMIPASAAPDVQEAFRQMAAEIERLRAAAGLNIDLKGKRITNAGRGLAPTDYVTKQQMDAAIAPAGSQDADFKTLTVRALARLLGVTFLPRLTDGSKHHVVLFVAGNGAVSGTNDGGDCFAYNDTDALLELGFDMRIKWVSALASIGSPADGVVNVLDNAGTGFLRLVLGLDDATGVALVKNGATLELRVGGGGALTDLTIDDLTADVITANTISGTVANGGNAAFTTVVVGTDPGGVDPLRVGGAATFNGDTNAHRVDGTSFRVNGHAGVDFGPGPIASITIEKGIVTAAS